MTKREGASTSPTDEPKPILKSEIGDSPTDRDGSADGTVSKTFTEERASSASSSESDAKTCGFEIRKSEKHWKTQGNATTGHQSRADDSGQDISRHGSNTEADESQKISLPFTKTARSFKSKIPPDIKKADFTALKAAQGGGRVRFPVKLHLLLEESETNGYENVVSWLPCGTAFRVHDKKTFCSHIMARFFQSNKFKTFQRSLNVWGFECVSQGRAKGTQFHPLFLRGRIDLCKQMVRTGIKDPSCPSALAATSAKKKRSFGEDRDESPSGKIARLLTRKSSLKVHQKLAGSLRHSTDLHAGGVVLDTRRALSPFSSSSAPNPKDVAHDALSHPKENPTSFRKDLFAPFSDQISKDSFKHSSNPALGTANFSALTCLSPSSSFVERLYSALDEPSIGFIHWRPHGRCFEIIDSEGFDQHVLSLIFGFSSLSLLRKELAEHGIYRIQNPMHRDVGCYYHDLLVRGFPHLCQRMRTADEAFMYGPNPEKVEKADFYEEMRCSYAGCTENSTPVALSASNENLQATSSSSPSQKSNDAENQRLLAEIINILPLLIAFKPKGEALQDMIPPSLVTLLQQQIHQKCEPKSPQQQLADLTRLGQNGTHNSRDQTDAALSILQQIQQAQVAAPIMTNPMQMLAQIIGGSCQGPPGDGGSSTLAQQDQPALASASNGIVSHHEPAEGLNEFSGFSNNGKIAHENSQAIDANALLVKLLYQNGYRA